MVYGFDDVFMNIPNICGKYFCGPVSKYNSQLIKQKEKYLYF